MIIWLFSSIRGVLELVLSDIAIFALHHFPETAGS